MQQDLVTCWYGICYTTTGPRKCTPWTAPGRAICESSGETQSCRTPSDSAHETIVPFSVPGEAAANGVREGGGGRPVVAHQVEEELRPQGDRLLRESLPRPAHQRRR